MSGVAAAVAFGLGAGASAADLKMAGVMSGKDRNALELSGHINRQIMFFDDGDTSGARNVDNWYSESRMTMKAKGKAGDLDVGATLQIGFGRYQTQAAVSQTAQTPAPAGENIGRTRISEFYVGSKDMGRIYMGRGSSAWDGANGAMTHGSFVHWNANAYLEAGGFLYRHTRNIPTTSEAGDGTSVYMAAVPADNGPDGMPGGGDDVVATPATCMTAETRCSIRTDAGEDAAGFVDHDNDETTDEVEANLDGQLSTFLVRDTIGEIDGTRRSRIMYVTPSLGGLTAKISHASIGDGEDDGAYAGGLFYSGKMGGITAKAAAGYQKLGQTDRYALSLGLGHSSGLGIALSYGELDNGVAGNEDDEIFYVAGSYSAKLSEMGKTIFVVSYTNKENTLSNGDEAEAYRISIQQNVDAAALELFATYTHFSYDDDVVFARTIVRGADDNGEIVNTSVTGHQAEYDDLQILTFGGRVKF